MSDNAPATSITQQRLDQRLDEIDRALMGLLPRSERLSIMAQVENSVRAHGDSNPLLQVDLPSSSLLTSSASAVTTRRQRSRLALSAGILGIIAFALLIATPFALILLSMVTDLVGEELSIGLFGSHMVLLALAGTLSVGFGIIALVKIARSRGTSFGSGWAITGLCTGPLPMLVGGMMILVVGMQLLAAEGMSVSVATNITAPNAVQATPISGEAGYYATSDVPPLPAAPALPAPSAMPATVPASTDPWLPAPTLPTPVLPKPGLPPQDASATLVSPLLPTDEGFSSPQVCPLVGPLGLPAAEPYVPAVSEPVKAPAVAELPPATVGKREAAPK